MKNRSKTVALCGLLSALALVLSIAEGLLPPIPGLPPGAKPGLSNLVTMFAGGTLGLPYALALAVIKGVFSLFTRGVIAGCMSLLGGLLSAGCMWLVYRKTRFSLLFVGVCGALAHNTAQLALAFFLTGPAALVYLPGAFFMSILFGAVTGLTLQALLPLLKRLPFLHR